MPDEEPLVSASGRYRAAIRQHGDAGWQFAILIYRSDLKAWWPVLRYLGIFTTRDAAQVEARTVLEEMEQPPGQRTWDAASERGQAMAMAVETAERIAGEFTEPADGDNEDG